MKDRIQSWSLSLPLINRLFICRFEVLHPKKTCLSDIDVSMEGTIWCTIRNRRETSRKNWPLKAGLVLPCISALHFTNLLMGSNRQVRSIFWPHGTLEEQYITTVNNSNRSDDAVFFIIFIILLLVTLHFNNHIPRNPSVLLRPSTMSPWEWGDKAQRLACGRLQMSKSFWFNHQH